VLVIAQLVCKICYYLIENFKSSVSLIKVYGRIKVRLKKQQTWRKKETEEIQRTAKNLLQTFRKVFSGKFLSISTGRVLAADREYKHSCHSVTLCPKSQACQNTAACIQPLSSIASAENSILGVTLSSQHAWMEIPEPLVGHLKKGSGGLVWGIFFFQPMSSGWRIAC